MLKITDLHARVEGKEILRGLNLEVNAGEVHAIMGPNGSGKSTLAQVLAGRDTFEVTAGRVDLLIDGCDNPVGNLLIRRDCDDRRVGVVFCLGE